MRVKKLIGEVELTKDLILLLCIGGLYSLSVALSNTFVNVYLWKQSGKFVDLGIYNLSIVVFQPFTFILAGRIAKKVDRIVVLRLGVIFLTTYYLTVLLVGTKATDFLILLGALLGIGYGFYWLAYNVLTFEVTEPETRDFFNGFLGIMNSLGGMIGPFVAGWIISRLEKFTGYFIVFGISLFLFAIAVILSFSLKRRPAHGRYVFMEVYRERNNNANWRLITNAHFFQGLREGTFVFIISVFVYITTGSELALGTFGLINSGVSFLVYYIASRLIKNQYRKKAILIGGVGLYLSILLIVFNLSYVKLLLYAASIAVFYPLLLVPYISLTYDVIGRSKNAGEMRVEYIVIRELFLNLGRAVSIIVFLVAISFFHEEKIIPILLLILGAGHTCIYFFIRKMNLQFQTS